MREKFDVDGMQSTRRHNCWGCGEQIYESLLRACPERGGMRMCMYCCRNCEKSYSAMGGQGCRAADEAKKANGAA